MQPRCRQVPPTLSFSMSTTDLPSSAASRDAAYPLLPPPRMMRSDWLSATAAPAPSKGRLVHLGTTRTVPSHGLRTGDPDGLPVMARASVRSWLAAAYAAGGRLTECGSACGLDTAEEEAPGRHAAPGEFGRRRPPHRVCQDSSG